MFETVKNMDDKFCNLSVGFIGKTAEIWNKQGFAKEFKLLEENPLEPVYQEVSETIYDWLDDKQTAIIWGASIDESLDDVIRVSILIGE